MHKLYKGLWDLSGNISVKFGMKKFWFLLLSIIFWIMCGALLYFSANAILGIKFVWKNLFITTLYIATIMGYYGGVMYMFRNTTPEDMS